MPALAPHPDRLFPADPGVRALARQLYATVADLPRIPAFTVEVTRHLDALLRRGVAATVAEHLAH